MKLAKRIVAAVFVVGAVAIAAMSVRERPPPPLDVQVATAKKAPVTRTVAGAGKIQAATTVKLSSNITGDLLELSVKAGDRVAKGQVLGKIDKRRYEATMKQAFAAHTAALADAQASSVEVERSRAELARVDGLTQKGMASAAEKEKAQADFDAATARYAGMKERATQAAARLEEAQNDLSRTTLVAPIDGTVIEVPKEVGERVRGSELSEDVVMTIAALALMEVRIEVGEHEVVYLKEGQKADIQVDALENQTFTGTVTEIAQKALIRGAGTEQETTNFPVVVSLPVRPPGVLPGMSAEVRIATESRDDALVVPVQAVTVRPEKALPDQTPVEGQSLKLARGAEKMAKVVFVVDAENKARIRRIRPGIASDTAVEIVEGLKEGEKIVEGPFRTLSRDLKDGDTVQEAKPGDKPKRHRG